MPDWLTKFIAWLLERIAAPPVVMSSGPVFAIAEADGEPSLIAALEPGQARVSIAIPAALSAAWELPGFQVLIAGDGASPLQVAIDGWSFAASGAGDGSFSNLILVKNVQASLRGLIADPSRWREPGRYDPMVVVQWLLTQFDRGLASQDTAFDHFKSIADDPSWQGILVLQMTIAAVPAALADLSIPQVTAAHHLGITRISRDAEYVAFGLIDYPDLLAPLEAFPDNTMRSLKVLFANSTVTDFSLEAPPRSFAYMAVNSS